MSPLPPDNHPWRWIFLAIACWVLMAGFYLKAISIQNGAPIAGHPYIWSDWTLHIAQIHRFALYPVSEWFSSHMVFGEAPMTYPFVANLISGLLMRLGLPLVQAITIPTLLTSALLVIGILRLSKLATNTFRIGSLALVLLLTSSGVLGAIRWIVAALQHPTEWLNPSKTFTSIPELDWGTGNLFLGMLYPQRAFLLGMALFVWILIVGWQGMKERNALKLTVAAILMPLLLLTHVHSWIVASIALLTSLIILRPSFRALWPPVGIAVIGSLFAFLLYYGRGVESSKFLEPLAGWVFHDKGSIGFVAGWLQLWGIFLPLWLTSHIAFRTALSKEMRILSWTGWLTFLFANLFLISPTHWDNSKLFFYAYFCGAFIIAYGLSRWWRTGKQVLVLASLLLLTASGIVELRRGWIDGPYAILSAQEVSFGEFTRSLPLNSRIASAPSHINAPVMLAGHTPVLGYTGWALNFGFPGNEREMQLREAYQTADPTRFTALGATHILVGARERQAYGIDPFFDLPLVYDKDDIRLYALPVK